MAIYLSICPDFVLHIVRKPKFGSVRCNAVRRPAHIVHHHQLSANNLKHNFDQTQSISNKETSQDNLNRWLTYQFGVFFAKYFVTHPQDDKHAAIIAEETKVQTMKPDNTFQKTNNKTR